MKIEPVSTHQHVVHEDKTLHHMEIQIKNTEWDCWNVLFSQGSPFFSPELSLK